jgi:hypothetical protein
VVDAPRAGGPRRGRRDKEEVKGKAKPTLFENLLHLEKLKEKREASEKVRGDRFPRGLSA